MGGPAAGCSAMDSAMGAGNEHGASVEHLSFNHRNSTLHVTARLQSTGYAADKKAQYFRRGTGLFVGFCYTNKPIGSLVQRHTLLVTYQLLVQCDA